MHTSQKLQSRCPSPLRWPINGATGGCQRKGALEARGDRTLMDADGLYHVSTAVALCTMTAVPLGRIPRIDRSERLAETSELSACVSLIGGAWAPHIISHPLSGPTLRRVTPYIPGPSNRVLSQRLKDLESRDVVSRTLEESSPVSGRYLLTPLGQKLLPALSAIVDVGSTAKQQKTVHPLR